MHNEHLGAAGLPGLSPQVDQESRNFLKNHQHVVLRGVRVDDASIDADNTGKTYKIRAGTALAMVIAGPNTGKYVPADHASAPVYGDVTKAGILMEDLDMRGKDGVAEDKMASVLIHGFVDESQINFVGDANYEAAIKAVLPLVDFS